MGLARPAPLRPCSPTRRFIPTKAPSTRRRFLSPFTFDGCDAGHGGPQLLRPKSRDSRLRILRHPGLRTPMTWNETTFDHADHLWPARPASLGHTNGQITMAIHKPAAPSFGSFGYAYEVFGDGSPTARLPATGGSSIPRHVILTTPVSITPAPQRPGRPMVSGPETSRSLAVPHKCIFISATHQVNGGATIVIMFVAYIASAVRSGLNGRERYRPVPISMPSPI